MDQFHAHLTWLGQRLCQYIKNSISFDILLFIFEFKKIKIDFLLPGQEKLLHMCQGL